MALYSQRIRYEIGAKLVQGRWKLKAATTDYYILVDWNFDCKNDFKIDFSQKNKIKIMVIT